jgi:SAM-dependent methyltransferase
MGRAEREETFAVKGSARKGNRTADPRREYFDQLAPDWDTRGQDPRQTLKRLDGLRDTLDLRAGLDLLEVGCGTGQITAWLSERVRPGRVLGIDFSAEMVKQARRKHPQMEFRVVDVCTDDLGDACFDVVLCFHSFPHFRDKPAALARISRCLRPGGRLVVMHLAGRETINARHTGFGGAVGSDYLPPDDQWPRLLRPHSLEPGPLIDQQDLFLLIAVKRTVARVGRSPS